MYDVTIIVINYNITLFTAVTNTHGNYDDAPHCDTYLLTLSMNVHYCGNLNNSALHKHYIRARCIGESITFSIPCSPIYRSPHTSLTYNITVKIKKHNFFPYQFNLTIATRLSMAIAEINYKDVKNYDRVNLGTNYLK